MTFEVMPDAGHPQPAQPNQVLVAGSTKDRVGDAFVLAGWGARRLTGRKTGTTVDAIDVD